MTSLAGRLGAVDVRHGQRVTLATNLATVPQVRRNWAVAGEFGAFPSLLWPGQGYAATFDSEPDGQRTRYFGRKTITNAAAVTAGGVFGSMMSNANPNVTPMGANAANLMPVTAGQTITFARSHRAHLAAGNVLNAQLTVGGFDATGNRISLSTSPPIPVPLDGQTWSRIAGSYTVPAGVVGLGAVFTLALDAGSLAAIANGDFADVADVLITADDPPPDYFDGDSPNGQWLGTPNNSRSRLLGLDPPLAVDAVEPRRQIITATNLATVPQATRTTVAGEIGARPRLGGNDFSYLSETPPGGALRRYLRSIITTTPASGLDFNLSVQGSSAATITNFDNVLAVTPGSAFVVACWRRNNCQSGVGGEVRFYGTFWDASGNVVGAMNTWVFPGLVLPNGQWVACRTSPITVPAGAAYYIGGWWMWTASPGFVVQVGDTADIADTLITTDLDADYFDGDMPGPPLSAWLGTPNASRSVRLGLAAPLGVVAASVLRET